MVELGQYCCLLADRVLSPALGEPGKITYYFKPVQTFCVVGRRKSSLGGWILKITDNARLYECHEQFLNVWSQEKLTCR